MLIRGYGLRTTNDSEENDPKHFELFGVDYLMNRMQEDKNNDLTDSKLSKRSSSDSLGLGWNNITDEKWVSLHSVKE